MRTTAKVKAKKRTNKRPTRYSWAFTGSSPIVKRLIRRNVGKNPTGNLAYCNRATARV
jgi:hypothetical protein